MMFNKTLEGMHNEQNLLKQELNYAVDAVDKIKQDQEKEIMKIKLEHLDATDKLKSELYDITEDKNKIQDLKFALEEKIQQQQDIIAQLDEQKRKYEQEVELRKEVQDQMSRNLLKHEEESMHYT